MKVSVHGKDLKISQEVSERYGEKLAFLEKYFMIDASTVASVMAKKSGKEVKAEITIPTKIGTLRSEASAPQLDDAVDQAISKLEGQIRRQKDRLSRRHKDKLAKSFVEETPEEKDPVEKRKRIVLEEIDTDEAILQLELSGHDFYIYKEGETTCVLYRRKDGTYGVIEAV